MHLRIAASIAVRVARLTTGRAGSLCRRDFHPLDDYTKFQFFISFLLLVQHFLVTPHVGTSARVCAMQEVAAVSATISIHEPRRPIASAARARPRRPPGDADHLTMHVLS